MTWVDAWQDPYSDYYGEQLTVPSGPSVPLPDPWHIYVRDSTYRRVAEVSQAVEFKATLRFNNVSTWTVTLSAEDDGVDLFNQPLSGIEVRYKGLLVLSGPTAGSRRVWDARSNHVIFNGFSDDIWLAARVVEPLTYQQRGNALLPYGAAFILNALYDTESGVHAETAIKHYVDANLGAGAAPDRRLAGLTIPPDHGPSSTPPVASALGGVVSENGRFQQLIAVLQNLALAGGDIGFKLTAEPLPPDGLGPVFDCYLPTDRTQQVVIAPEFENLTSFQYDVQAPISNVVYEGAADAGANRTMLIGKDATSIARWGRFETFTDEQDTSDQTTLVQRAVATLQTNQAQTSSSAVPNLEAGDAVFMDNWVLGDAITTVIDNQPLGEKVRQVELTINAQGINATVGQAAGGQTPPGPPWQLLDRRLSTRIRNLERR